MKLHLEETETYLYLYTDNRTLVCKRAPTPEVRQMFESIVQAVNGYEAMRKALESLTVGLVPGWPPENWADNNPVRLQVTAGDIRKARTALARKETPQ